MKARHRLRLISRLLLISSVALLAAGCASKSNWLMFRGKQGAGYTSTSILPPLAVKWKLRLQYNSNAALSFNPPVIYDNTIYFGSNDGNFYALDIENGYMRWVFKTDGSINSVPAVDEKYVYFGSNNGIFYCVSRTDGKQVWSYDTGHQVQSTTTIYKDNVIFTSDIGATYVFSPLGVEKFQIPNMVWLYHAFQVYDGVIYFAPGPASMPYSLGAYDLKYHGYLWLLDTGRDDARWYSFPALKGNDVYYATEADPTGGRDLHYYALNRKNGNLVWAFSDTPDPGPRAQISEYQLFDKNMKLLDYLAPAIWKNLVIYTSGDSVVRAFNRKNGSIAWEHDFQYPTSSAPTIAGDRVYFGLHGDNLSGNIPSTSPDYTSPKIVCLSARNGKTLWQMDIEGSLLSAPVISGKWIVFGTDQNIFYVLEEVF